METVLNLGADPSRIIYANPYKQASHIKYAGNARRQRSYQIRKGLVYLLHLIPDTQSRIGHAAVLYCRRIHALRGNLRQTQTELSFHRGIS